MVAPRCCGLPFPDEPKFNSPGLALASATSSCTDFAGTSGFTTSRNWMRATCVTGSRSVSGSNGCLPRCGLTENTLSGASNQVCPSGGLFATRSEPMFWLPPVRFSTTTGCGQTPCRFWASARAMVSGEPPGVSGTMILTGRSGKPCAAANAEKIAISPVSSHLPIEISPAVDFAPPVYLFERAAYDGLSQEEIPMLTPEELEQLSGAESLFP